MPCAPALPCQASAAGCTPRRSCRRAPSPGGSSSGVSLKQQEFEEGAVPAEGVKLGRRLSKCLEKGAPAPGPARYDSWWLAGFLKRMLLVELDNSRDGARAEQDSWQFWRGSTANSTDSSLTELERSKIMRALEEVREAVAAMPTTTAEMEPLDDALFGRVLVVTGFDAPRAIGLVKAYVAFRKEYKGFGLPDQEAGGCGAFQLIGEDRRGRPVLLLRGKYCDTRTPVPVMRRIFRAYMDVIIVHLLRRRPALAESNPLEQYVCVVDVEGIGRANVSLQFLRMLVGETSVYYPERLQETVVIGATAAVRMMWASASGLVHPRTRKKMRIVAPHDVHATMRGLMPEEMLPENYGGSAPALEDPANLGLGVSVRHVGALAAAIWQEREQKSPASDSGSSSGECHSPTVIATIASPTVICQEREQESPAACESCMGGLLDSLTGGCLMSRSSPDK